MQTKYFSIFDKKAAAFGQVFPSHSFGTAERSFKDALNNPDSPHNKYPDDFALYHLFVLDDESGYVIETFEPPQLIVEATSLVS